MEVTDELDLCKNESSADAVRKSDITRSQRLSNGHSLPVHNFIQANRLNQTLGNHIHTGKHENAHGLLIGI